MKKAYFSWSSGKDSALALYEAIESGKYKVETLFSAVEKNTTILPCTRLARIY